MKIKKLLLLILLIPMLVLAEGPSAEEKLALLPSYEEGGKEYLDIDIMDFSNYPIVCDWEKEGDCEGGDNYIESWQIIELALVNKGIEIDEIIDHVSQTNYKIEVDKALGKVTISAYDGYPDEPWDATFTATKEYYLNFKNKITNEKANNVVSKIKNKEFKLTGNQYLNMMANIDDFELETFVGEDIDTFIDYYDDLKSVFEENDEFVYTFSNGPSGGSWFWDAGKIVGIFKDDILIACTYIHFFNYYNLMVPEGEGTLLERANSVIANEFPNNNKPTFELDDDQEWLMIYGQPGNLDYYNEVEEFTTEMNNYYGLSKTTYNTSIVKVTLNGNVQRFILSEIPQSKYKKYTTKSKNFEYDVSIESGGYDVAGDAHLNVDDLSNDQTIKENGKKNNYFVEKVYDLKLKRGYDGSYVEQTPLGTNVYVPISGHKEGDRVRVFYVKDKEFQPEEIIGTVVKKDGKNYLHFVTTHFSVFAIERGETNPQTGDNLIYNLIITISVLLTFIQLIIYKKRYI